MPFPIQEFWNLAVESRLFTPDECKRLGGAFAQIRGASETGNAFTLSEWLISQKVLTRYQAKVLLARRAGPFIYGDYRVQDRIDSGRLQGLPRAENISNADLLTCDCDILVPAALESVLTEGNAANVKARIVAEAANGPTTPGADRILQEKGILVIPDILCNAGGVTVSYFEWVQDREEFFWTIEEINARLRRLMGRAFEDTHRVAQEHSVNMRLAAYMLAVGRVAESTLTRGIYP